MARLDVVQHGSDRLRIGPWRGDHGVAYIAPVPGRPPALAAIDECLTRLRQRGYRSVLTSALARAEQDPFLAAGFSVHERLHLLKHDLEAVPAPPAGISTRRFRARDENAMLRVDHSAFDAFWRFDRQGLADARKATPSARARVVERAEVVGYAITGRAGRAAYLQRLAVDPAHQGQRLGMALIVDALLWARRRGAVTMLVNTQEANRRALTVYETVGFTKQEHGLAVLELPLAGELP